MRGAQTPAPDWRVLVDDDPVPWLLDTGDPAARWVTLVQVLDRPRDDPAVRESHAAVLGSPLTLDLLARLPDWAAPTGVSGHNSPAFAPNLLNLLAETGVEAGELAPVERLLDDMLDHQEEDGRFASLGAVRSGEAPVWGALLCDSHAVLEVLVRFGRADDVRVRAGLARMAADLAQTAQGPAWPCLPHSVTGWRGPGRRGDFCPMVTLEALRTFARLEPSARPDGLLDAARTSLRAWRERGAEKPYQFGHGIQFKTVKWPATWYGAYAVLDALGRYPELWREDGREEDARSLAEITACLVAHNVAPDGTVTPRSTYRGFEQHSLGRKKQPSPLATALLLAVLHRLDDLAPLAAAVDVTRLTSSKGGAGTAIPPR